MWATRNGPEVGASVVSRRAATGRGFSACSGRIPIRVRFTKPALGLGSVYTTVSGSGAATVIPPHACPTWVWASERSWSTPSVYTASDAVIIAPSDHLSPRRRWNVKVLTLASTSHLLASRGSGRASGPVL